MRKKVLIAIPAFNEVKNIGSVLNILRDYKKNILVVDDGSTDDTRNIVDSMEVSVVSHKNNLGLSAAYNSMFNFADSNNYTHMVTLDGDGQHDPSYVSHYIKMLDNYDFVIGNRFSFPEEIPPTKLASNFFAVMLTRITFGNTLPDVACGFRAMKLDKSTKLIHSLHYGVVYEMLFKELNNKKEIGVVNIPAKYDLSERLLTNTNEIFGLLGELIRYNPMEELKNISYNLFMGSDFEINMQGYTFRGRYIDSFNYELSTDLEKAKHFYEDFFN